MPYNNRFLDNVECNANSDPTCELYPLTEPDSHAALRLAGHYFSQFFIVGVAALSGATK